MTEVQLFFLAGLFRARRGAGGTTGRVDFERWRGAGGTERKGLGCDRDASSLRRRTKLPVMKAEEVKWSSKAGTWSREGCPGEGEGEGKGESEGVMVLRFVESAGGRVVEVFRVGLAGLSGAFGALLTGSSGRPLPPVPVRTRTCRVPA